MTSTLLLPQALVIRSATEPRVVAQSEEFGFELEELALRTAVGFGPRPPGIACPEALFALLADEGNTVFIVQVRDLPTDPSVTDPLLGFRFIAVDRSVYAYEFAGDPFGIADHFPPDWFTRGRLPDLDGGKVARKKRTIADVQNVLKTGDGPSLLGTTQALIDGGHVAAQRDTPDPAFVRGVWQLLPDRIRAELWPATFAFSPDLRFHLVVLPSPPPAGYLGEEQAKDYPESRYELALQSAAESGDQAELDRLFARKTSKEVLRLAIGMVLFALVIAAVMKFL